MNITTLVIGVVICVFMDGVWGADGVVYATAPQERGAYAVGRPGGRYNYGYNTGDGIAKVEVRQPDGSIVGSYRYFDPNGKQVVRTYIADKQGFRVLGNDLPISPDTPVSKIAGAPAFTGAVEGTAEFNIPPPLNPSSRTSYQQLNSHQQHLETYRKQQEQIEQQKEQLRREQEKLAALQRELENQQTSQQSYYRPNYYYPGTNKRLSSDYTTPYYYYQDQLEFDFPAGFAYTGLPIIKVPPPREITYPKSTYIIGQATHESLRDWKHRQW